MATAARVAFYKAKHGNIVDKAIAWWTNSEYSHVELVCCGLWYSTSPRDLRVRRQKLIPKESHWDYIDVDIDPAWVDKLFENTQGAKYDWTGIFLTQFIPLDIHNRKRYFCSEWVADALKFQKPHSYSPEDLYKKLIK